MANRLHVGTRKGLFELTRNNGVCWCGRPPTASSVPE